VINNPTLLGGPGMKFSRRFPAVMVAVLATVVGLGVLAAAQSGVYRSLPGPGDLTTEVISTLPSIVDPGRRAG
jgi:hypothetical protein